jgi:hypothetical protein
MMVHSTALSLVLVYTATACSPGPMPVSKSPRDPSNPSAQEGVLPTVPAAASAPTRTEDSHATHVHDHAGPRASGSAGSAQGLDTADAGVSAGYVCPMHPEVTSSAPGRCPKCGMNLVPKK